MVKFLPVFVMIFFTQVIAIIMWGEYVWLAQGQYGRPITNIQPVFLIILLIELLWFIYSLAMEKKRKEDNLSTEKTDV